MVYHFQCSDPKYFIYMGKDKFENEELIKYAFPEDLWFHVDKFSSAHVYLRPVAVEDQQRATEGTLKGLPSAIVEEISQLTKENSISGKKEISVRIVYTPAFNLKKTGNMDIGEVGFHDMKLVKYYNVAKRNKEIVNRVSKTRVEKNVNFKAELEKREKDEVQRNKEEKRKQKEEEQKQFEQKRKEAEDKSYSAIFANTENMRSNQDESAFDDFM